MSEWIKFNSGVQPVPDGVKVTIKTADGDIETGIAEGFAWELSGYDYDIVAYRVEVDNMSNPIFKPEDIIDIARLKRDNNWSNEELAAYLQGKPMSNQDKPAFPYKPEIRRQVTEDMFTVEQGDTPGMSLREYAAIKLRVPDSGTDWLDAMIEKSLLNEFAGKAMQGIMASWGQHDVTDFEEIASDSKNLANAMLKASKGE